MQRDDEDRYSDMLRMPHHVSSKYPRMPLRDRAAQFAAFNALTGYEESVREAARTTETRMELDDYSLSVLRIKLRIMKDFEKNAPEISVTYFVSDKKKDGGEYVTVHGKLKRFDEAGAAVIFTDGRSVPVEDIADISGGIFADIEAGYFDI